MIKFFQILFSPLSIIYYGIIKLRNFFFDKGILHSEKVDSKVISVGNIVVGGSGKTPTVIYITKLLKKNNLSPAILSRGYGRDSKGFLLVSDGEKLLSDVKDSGDEIYLEAEECMVPSAVCEKRVIGAKKLIEKFNPGAIVLDDAFQHRWIKRDLDILIFDQRFLLKTGKREQKILPLGNMREPFSSTNRADIILINRKFSEKENLDPNLLKYFEGKKVFHAHYEAKGFYDVKDHKYYSFEEFAGQKSLVVCGIARPYSFLRRLELNNIDIKNKLLFSDHKDYSDKEIQQIRKKFYETNSYSVLTTQKDAVKLYKYSKELDDIDIYYLKIDLVVDEKEFNEEILNIFNN